MKITLDEFQDNFKYEILKPTDCVETFQCGDEDLDNFIIKESADYTKSLLSITYIVTDKSKKRVVAYFSLAADKLSVNDFASNSEFNRFRKRRFVHEKRLRSYFFTYRRFPLQEPSFPSPGESCIYRYQFASCTFHLES
jgi:hypothetical protein